MLTKRVSIYFNQLFKAVSHTHNNYTNEKMANKRKICFTDPEVPMQVTTEKIL